jgi:hypothetical protein
LALFSNSFKNLAELDLSGSTVSEQQLELVAELVGLRVLRLAKTAISDRGVEQLASLSNLETLDLTGTAISPVVLQRLSQKLKQLQIVQ